VRRLAAAFVAVWTLFSQPAAAVTVEWAGERFDLPVPGRMCALLKTEPVDRELIESQERVQANENIVMLAFAACDELDDYRNVRRKTLGYFGFWFMMAPDGKPARTPSTTTRARFVKAMSSMVPVLDLDATARMASGEAKAGEVSRLVPNETARTVLERTKREGAAVAMKAMGQIHQTQDALYVAGLSSVDGLGSDLAGVSALTLIGDRPFSLNVYKPYVDRKTYDELLLTVTTMVDVVAGKLRPLDDVDPKDLFADIKVSGSGQRSSTETYLTDDEFFGRYDWEKVLRKGIVGAMVGGVFAVLFMVFRGFRRKR